MKNNKNLLKVSTISLLTALGLSVSLIGCHSGSSGTNNHNLNNTHVQTTNLINHPMVNALADNDYVCISDYYNVADTTSGGKYCRSFVEAPNLQLTFAQVLDGLETYIKKSDFESSTKGLAQPTTTIIPNWDALNKEERAKKLSDYGFEQAQPKLKDLIDKTCKDSEVCIKYFLATTAKTIDRVDEKFPDGQVQGNLDYSRATIVANYSDLQNLLIALKSIGERNYNFGIAVVKDRIAHPTSTHYRDLQLLLKDNNTGFISEVLVLSPRMQECKNGLSHSLYEIVRTNGAKIKELEQQIPVDHAAIKDLQESINVNNKRLFEVHDDIFRADSATSCIGQDLAGCINDAKKFIISHDCGAEKPH